MVTFLTENVTPGARAVPEAFVGAELVDEISRRGGRCSGQQFLAVFPQPFDGFAECVVGIGVVDVECVA